VVASRGDTYLAGSLFEMFRLLRVSLIEQVGCREISILFESALILHGIVAQPVDTVLFIWILLSVRLRGGMGSPAEREQVTVVCRLTIRNGEGRGTHDDGQGSCPPTLRKMPRRMGHPPLWGWSGF